MSQDAYRLISPEGKELELPVHTGTSGPDVIDVARLYREQGVFTYDPGFVATGSCKSDITFIDGEEGVLQYRGYPVEQLAEKSSFIEVCYLLLHGHLPTQSELDDFENTIRRHTMLNEGMLNFFKGFRYDAHPMAQLSAVVGSMSAYYHSEMDASNPKHRDIFAHRIVAKLPTIAAAAYKLNVGQPFIYPRNDLNYSENFLHMMFAVPSEDLPGRRGRSRRKRLNLILILHADHEQNCSDVDGPRRQDRAQVRISTLSAIAAGISCAVGTIAHGGANRKSHARCCKEFIGDVKRRWLQGLHREGEG